MDSSEADDNNPKSAFAHLTDAIDNRIPFRSVHVWLIMLIASGALFDGIEQFNVSYVAPILRTEWNLSEAGVGYLTSATFAGLATGAVVAGIVADRFGRRVTFMYNLALYTGGALLCAFAPNLTVLIIARIIVGFGLGGELNVGVTMLSELMPTKKRGPATAVANIATGGLGLFASAALAALMLGPMSTLLGGESSAWRWYLGILALPALLIFVYRLFLPETPRYLLTRGRVHDTNVALTHLHSNRLRLHRGTKIIGFIPESSQGDDPAPQTPRFADILRGQMRRNSLTLWSISLMTFGAQIGLNAFLPTILNARGVPVAQTTIYVMVMNLGGFLGAVLAAIGGRYWPRRAVLTAAGACAGIMSLLFMAVAGQSVVLVLATGFALQLAMIMVNTTSWFYSPELYSTRVRGIGTGCFMMTTAIAGSISPIVFGYVMGALGMEAIFVVISVMYLILIIVARFGPETHGKSLEQLSELAESSPQRSTTV